MSRMQEGLEMLRMGRRLGDLYGERGQLGLRDPIRELVQSCLFNGDTPPYDASGEAEIGLQELLIFFITEQSCPDARSCVGEVVRHGRPKVTIFGRLGQPCDGP